MAIWTSEPDCHLKQVAYRFPTLAHCRSGIGVERMTGYFSRLKLEVILLRMLSGACTARIVFIEDVICYHALELVQARQTIIQSSKERFIFPRSRTPQQVFIVGEQPLLVS
jgi:hypothetical protein